MTSSRLSSATSTAGEPLGLSRRRQGANLLHGQSNNSKSTVPVRLRHQPALPLDARTSGQRSFANRSASSRRFAQRASSGLPQAVGLRRTRRRREGAPTANRQRPVPGRPGAAHRRPTIWP